MAIQQTYSMIKPDGVRNGHIGEIINRFERAGLTIERMELGMVTPEQAKANYAEHEGKPFYDGLIAYHHLRPRGEDGRLRRGRRGQVPVRSWAHQPGRGGPGHHPRRFRPHHGRERDPRLRQP